MIITEQKTLMLSTIFVSIGSLFFLFLLIISYFTKKGLPRLQSRLYKILLVTILVFNITDIILAFVIIEGNNRIIFEILSRIHWITVFFWAYVLYYYVASYLHLVELRNDLSLKELLFFSKKSKIYTIFLIISVIIFFFLRFSEPVIPLNYVTGLAVHWTLTIYLICTIYIIVVFSRKDIKKTKKEKLLIFLIEIESLLEFIIQYLFRDVALVSFFGVIQLYILYYIVENPDLYVVNELEKANETIEKSSHAKTDFISNMSHEITSPMNAIYNSSQTLIKNPEFNEEKVRNEIKRIQGAAGNLLDIVNNILDISKIESGNENLNLREYSLSSVALELRSIIEARTANKKVKFNMNIDKDIPSKYEGDSTKLFQILLNVLSNSVKYTEVGKIKFDITGEKKGETELLHFKISDTGFGIKEEDFNKLFEKFSRLDNASENDIEGSGLGLVITKKYVNLMNGKIWFESELDVGSTFYIDIPQKVVDDTPIGEITTPINGDEEKTTLDCTGLKVLVVDDNKLNLKVASRLLGKYNFDIETVDSAKECIYKIKSEEKFDIIFMDHMMPEMDGIEAIHILRRLEGYDLPPIIALTANAITGMREMYLREGFNEYLSKPINVSELDKIIMKFFAEKRGKKAFVYKNDTTSSVEDKKEVTPYTPSAQEDEEVAPYTPSAQEDEEVAPYTPSTQKDEEVAPYTPSAQADEEVAPYTPSAQADEEVAPYTPSTQKDEEVAPYTPSAQADEEVAPYTPSAQEDEEVAPYTPSAQEDEEEIKEYVTAPQEEEEVKEYTTSSNNYDL